MIYIVSTNVLDFYYLLDIKTYICFCTHEYGAYNIYLDRWTNPDDISPKYTRDTVNPTRIYMDISPRDWKFKIWINKFDNILLNKIIDTI